MYHEEKIINDVLCWRGTPNGEWHKFSDNVLTDRLAARDEEIKKLKEALRQMTIEFRYDDHNLSFPNCNCVSHQNYKNALALIAEAQ